jgi:hypothetical protein
MSRDFRNLYSELERIQQARLEREEAVLAFDPAQDEEKARLETVGVNAGAFAGLEQLAAITADGAQGVHALLHKVVPVTVGAETAFRVIDEMAKFAAAVTQVMYEILLAGSVAETRANLDVFEEQIARVRGRLDEHEANKENWSKPKNLVAEAQAIIRERRASREAAEQEQRDELLKEIGELAEAAGRGEGERPPQVS